MSEYTKLELLAGEYSDLHKDVFGVRPHGLDLKWTEEDYDRAINDLIPLLEKTIAAERAEEEKAIIRLEKRIKAYTDRGYTRKESIVHIAECENAYNGDYLDAGYFCFLVGVPYGYIKKEELE